MTSDFAYGFHWIVGNLIMDGFSLVLDKRSWILDAANLCQSTWDKIISTNAPFDINIEENREIINDLAFNHNIFNISMAMMVSGDVSSFYKAKKTDITLIKKINRTFEQ